MSFVQLLIRIQMTSGQTADYRKINRKGRVTLNKLLFDFEMCNFLCNFQ